VHRSLSMYPDFANVPGSKRFPASEISASDQHHITSASLQHHFYISITSHQHHLTSQHQITSTSAPHHISITSVSHQYHISITSVSHQYHISITSASHHDTLPSSSSCLPASILTPSLSPSSLMHRTAHASTYICTIHRGAIGHYEMYITFRVCFSSSPLLPSSPRPLQKRLSILARS
jgi:hypothetical protein